MQASIEYILLPIFYYLKRMFESSKILCKVLLGNDKINIIKLSSRFPPFKSNPPFAKKKDGIIITYLVISEIF